MRDYRGKVVVVTGAGGGLGRALCRRFSAAGARVAGLDLRPETVESAELALSCDVTDPASCSAALARVVEVLGGVDVLVNNAGISHRSLFADTGDAVLRKVMEVNFWGSVSCTRAALESLLERRGQIIVLSSVAGIAPLVARTGYAASKHALHGFFESLRCELADRGVGVVMICPSFLATGMDARVLGADGKPTAKPKPVVGRLLSPEEGAEAVFQAARAERALEAPGVMAKVAWWTRRLAPALYERMMTRSLQRELAAS